VADGGDGAVGREFSFPVDRERAMNGRLQPGESVDVLVTYGTGDSARTLVVAPGVRLLDVTEAGKATLGSNGKVVVTLLLTDAEQLLQAAHASAVGAVTLVRSTGATPGSPLDTYVTPGAPPRTADTVPTSGAGR
jgi:Flp pilus assembly protein CpaB